MSSHFARPGEKPTAIQHSEPQKRISLEEFFALIESDPERRYELIDGYPWLITGGSPDHSIIGLNMASILRELLRKRPCIAYNSDVYIQLNGEENCFAPMPQSAVTGEIATRQKLSAIPV